MKILYITNMYPTPDHIYNGIHVKEQIDYLIKKYGLDYHIEFINGRKSKLNYIRSIFTISKLLKKNKFDIMHIHFGLSAFFLLFNYNNIPKVITLHGSDTMANKLYGLMLKVTKLGVRRAQRVIILNDKMANTFAKYKYKLVKIPCGIDLNVFAEGRKNKNKVFRIGFPGNRNRKGKNFRLFEQIVRVLRSEGLKLEIIEFHNLARKEVVAKLSILDCLLMTSFYEGSPQIVKEAMAGNIPIISTDVGDVKELLATVANCYVVDSFEATQFISPIKSIVELSPTQRITNGKQRIIDLNLDQDTVVLRIFNVYSEILQKK